jgi:hypothetical protein
MIFKSVAEEKLYFDTLLAIINKKIEKYKIKLDFNYQDLKDDWNNRPRSENEIYSDLGVGDEIFINFEKRIAQFMVENSFSKDEENDLVKNVYKTFEKEHPQISGLRSLMQILLEIGDVDDYIIDEIKEKTMKEFHQDGIELCERDFKYSGGRLSFAIPTISKKEVEHILQRILMSFGK